MLVDILVFGFVALAIFILSILGAWQTPHIVGALALQKCYINNGVSTWQTAISLIEYVYKDK